MNKPRIKVKARGRMFGAGVPDNAQPGEMVVGNRGAAARVVELVTSGPLRLSCLTLDYVGNYDHGVRPYKGCKLYNFR